MKDAEALLDFKQAVLHETEFLLQGPEDTEGTVKEEVGLIGSFARHPGCVLLLAWDDDRVVGMCTVVAGALARSRHVGQTGMAVRRSHWRRGVGAALLAHALDWAAGDDALRKLSLQVHATNAPARRLYERFGFAYEGRLTGEARVGGAYVDLLAMGRTLS